MPGTKHNAELFARSWRGRGNEEQHTQLFWIGLLQDVLGLEDALQRLKFEEPVSTDKSDHKGYIDVLIPTASVLIEQKSVGVPLDKQEMRQGRMCTPAQQALDYAHGLPLSQQPRYVIACNFAEFWVYDRNIDGLCREPLFRLALEDLPKNLPAIQFLRGVGEAPESLSRAVSIEAGRIMGRLHAQVAASFPDPDEPTAHHALSVLMTRLMFLMFCEDSGLIGANVFRDYVRHYQAEDLRGALIDLFEWLDTPDENRDPWVADHLKAFPYMNGGLFRERVNFPPLSEDFRTTLIVDGCQEFDWSGVSPTVFGSIFEGALSHDHRRANGQHFTSPENIHKVIDPLFLTDLRAEFTRCCDMAPSQRTRALRALHRRLGEISVLDPAAGSGNFLTESYVCLRRLEAMVMFELAKSDQMAMTFEEADDTAGEDSEVLVSLRNFHGIEIEDFACCVARTALWIAEKQADADCAKVTRRVYQELPLNDYEGIIMGNALRIDWNEVVPADKVTHVCGNPPFIGQYTKTDSQKEDVRRVWGSDYDGYLDYATCWYRKAAEYLNDQGKPFAFVSTNSICQGQPVPALFGPLWRMGWEVSFAHRTFVWDSQADDEAHVHVVILGFEKRPKKRLLFTYERGRGEGVLTCPSNINGYLLDAPNVLVTKQNRPLGRIAEVVIGSKPADGGFLQIKGADYEAAMADPIAARYVRPCLGATELINARKRWCLWLEDAPAADMAKSPFLKERLEGCRQFRLASRKASTKRMAETPWIWGESRPMHDAFLCIPRHFSGLRRYFTAARCTHGEIATDACFMASDPDGLQFSVISSTYFMAWQKAVGGELKSDCRFSNTVVWNNFPLPDMTDAQRGRIIEAGQAIVDARASYEGLSLADLYDPSSEFLFPRLFEAHSELDAAMEDVYGFAIGDDEDDNAAHLFGLYSERAGQTS